jgi:hypothetical protein
MIPDPYVGAAKLVGIGLLVLVVLGGLARWKHVEGALRKTRGEVARLEADATARAKNADIAAIIRRGVDAKDAARATSVKVATKGVRDAKVPVPEVCKAAVRPLGVALDGVRRLRSERDGAAPARPRVLPGPGAAGIGRTG